MQPEKIIAHPTPAIELVTLAAAKPEYWLAICQWENPNPERGATLLVIDQDIDEARAVWGTKQWSGAMLAARAVEEAIARGLGQTSSVDEYGMFFMTEGGHLVYEHDCGERVFFGDPQGLLQCLRMVQLCSVMPKGADIYDYRHEIIKYVDYR